MSQTSNSEQATRALDRHVQNFTHYLTMSKELAVSGVETWVVDIRQGTIAFCEMTGAVLFEEKISGE